MTSFIIKRLASAVLTILVVSALTFSLAFLAGDPAIAIAGKDSSAADIARVREYYGFDRPVVIQYGEWLAKALTGDFGRSFHYQQSVADMLASRLPITFGLGVAAIIFALAIAVPLGVAAAAKPGGLIDRFALGLSVLGQAMPTFWLALLLVVLFGLTLRWLPISGNATWQHFVMPTIALGTFALPALLRITRAGTLDALRSDYVRTARAKGLGAGKVLFRHALRNVMIPLVSISAVQLGALLAGSIVIEQIFALQGIGALSYDATLRADLPVVQAITLIVAVFYVLLTLVADIVNAILDPRIRESW
ncbi:ABC transporter permease [Mesorhizobium microcysteis]|uniref:ABC transporter permease n=1 Tax=Neoaquamicrobium microcysteis TaxID=2682781 RepID=A0A5D4H5S5_9HYPH|nr:ABC transporter permease [Mesorhizobium microcysteis]MCA0344886.1 ABC transporter permease [Pseudomonadota bacterium]TYR36411.1 ABC transporter permease [Mesorhizobium microcysteis]